MSCSAVLNLMALGGSFSFIMILDLGDFTKSKTYSLPEGCFQTKKLKFINHYLLILGTNERFYVYDLKNQNNIMVINYSIQNN